MSAVATDLSAGPSAFSRDWRRLSSLTWLLAKTKFQIAYFNSVLGPLWSVMRPLLLFAVLYVVFTQIVDFGSGIPNYPVLLLLNMVLFNFFSEATGTTVTSLVENEGLVRKMHFPRATIPFATVLTACLNMGVNLVVVFLFVLAYGVDPQWTWLLMPLIVAPLILFATGVGMLLSALYVRYRDVSPIWSVASTMLFYGTPVLYVVTSAPEDFQRYLLFNPIAALLEQARHWIVDPTAPGTFDAIGGWPWIAVPILIWAGAIALGTWVFNREAPWIAERL
jgi:ABC-2 type transport system permease protein